MTPLKAAIAQMRPEDVSASLMLTGPPPKFLGPRDILRLTTAVKMGWRVAG
jgi:hypothetical protein